jgi:hypothetical protein
MIGQEIGLPYLILLALEKLEENILAEGDYYPGDLLKSVAKVNPKFWGGNGKLSVQLKKLLADNQELLISENISLSI